VAVLVLRSVWWVLRCSEGLVTASSTPWSAAQQHPVYAETPKNHSCAGAVHDKMVSNRSQRHASHICRLLIWYFSYLQTLRPQPFLSNVCLRFSFIRYWLDRSFVFKERALSVHLLINLNAWPLDPLKQFEGVWRWQRFSSGLRHLDSCRIE
jgi:hypothetical protein